MTAPCAGCNTSYISLHMRIVVRSASNGRSACGVNLVQGRSAGAAGNFYALHWMHACVRACVHLARRCRLDLRTLMRKTKAVLRRALRCLVPCEPDTCRVMPPEAEVSASCVIHGETGVGMGQVCPTTLPLIPVAVGRWMGAVLSGHRIILLSIFSSDSRSVQ